MVDESHPTSAVPAILRDAVTVAAEGAPAGENGPGLSRTLRARHVEMIAIGGIIGAGLFVGSSSAIAGVGPAVLLSYAGAGLIVLLVMRMLSEMAAAIPGVQSFPDFTRLGLGDWAGFMSGWLYWYFWSVVVAIEAIAGAAILVSWWPGLPAWQVAAALALVLAGVNLLSARSYGECEFWFSSLKVAAILGFILIAAAYLAGAFSNTSPGLGNLTAHGGFMPRGPLSALSGVTTVIFALVGAEIATIAAAESNAGSRIIARMTLTVAIRILLFYILSIGLIVAIVPWLQVVPGQSSFAVALDRIGVPGGVAIMQAIVLVAVLSCLNSGLYVASRVMHGLALRNEAPERLAIRMWLHPAGTIFAIMSILMVLAAMGLDRELRTQFQSGGVIIGLVGAACFLFRRRPSSVS